jgi:isocitrate dehydrogenase
MSTHSSTTQPTATPVTVIPGDGIGQEVMDATLTLIEAAGGRIAPEVADAGGVAFQRGVDSGVPAETIDSIGRTAVVLKGPLATPVGFGNKSANVTLRKFFETFANVRPARELPGVPSAFAGRGIDLVIVRENVEDLYAGIEHMQTPNVAQCLKLISRLGCQRVSRAAFAYAVAEGRSSVVAATKANIMKLTEGMFKAEFEDVARNYPDIAASHMLIDNCAHQLVMKPEQFDVIVTSNMNGDIISDLASGLVGGLGFAPSANIGYEVAMFEPVHGTAPDIAGTGVANPTAMVLSAVMMLRHIAQFEAAHTLEQSLFRTLEDGILTQDIARSTGVGTQAFTEAIQARMGQASSTPSRDHDEVKLVPVSVHDVDSDPGARTKVGVDIFIETGDAARTIGERLQRLSVGTPYSLKMISNRGTQVWPATGASPTCVDHYRCRFTIADSSIWSPDSVLDLLARIGQVYRWMHVEKLEQLDGQNGFTKAQGEN